MADPARLDELRRQFEANPRRYFAPLASALRRAGDPRTAVTLTRAQLAAYPEHLTGHVILGQALGDLGDHDGARAAFEQAHAVDAGNTVALEALVTLTRRAGDERGAAHWVGLLREADPEHPMAAATPVTFEPLDLDEFGADEHDADNVGVAASREAEFEADPFSSATLDPRLAVVPLDEVAPVHPTAVAGAADAAVRRLAEESPAEHPGAKEPAFEPLDDVLERAHDPVVGLDVAPADPLPTPMREALPALVAGDERAGDLGNDRAPAPEPDAGDPPPPAAPFVTETMAGLLLAQGHRAQALDVYGQLLAQRPDDERLRARVASLCEETGTPAVDDPPIGDPAAAAPAAAEPAAAEPAVNGPAAAAAPARADQDERAARMWRVAFAAVPAIVPVAAEAAPAAAPGDDPDDDLAQFTAWLRQLAA